MLSNNAERTLTAPLLRNSTTGIASIIWITHFALCVVILLFPFLAPVRMLPYYAAGCVLMMTHWMHNNNACFLSSLEAKARGHDSVKHGFFYNALYPLFGIGRRGLTQDSTTAAVRASTIMLICVALFRILLFYTK